MSSPAMTYVSPYATIFRDESTLFHDRAQSEKFVTMCLLLNMLRQFSQLLIPLGLPL
jgi:hypothetical protein